MPSLGQNPAAKARDYADRVNAERDRRMKSRFYYGPHAFDWDDATKARVTAAAAMAGFAMGNGAVSGDYRWHGGTSDFGWILQDNTFLPLDAQAMFDVSRVAMDHESAHIFAARSLKDAATQVEDCTADIHWPTVAQ